MSGDELLRALLATFSDEAAEHLQAMNEGLVELERASDPEARERLLSETFRAAHSLKGAARAVGADGVETLAHGLETFFDAVRSGEARVDRAALDVVYRSLDAMGLLAREATGGEAADVNVAALSASLNQVVPAAPGERGNGDGGPPRRGIEPPPRGDGGAGREAEKGPGPASDSWSGRVAGETVRVATSKLDALAAQVGEMTVSQAESEQHGVELRALLHDVAQWEAAWRRTLSPGAARGSAASPPTADVLPLIEDARVRLRALRERLGRLDRSLVAGYRRRAQLTTDLQDDVRSIRMLPVSTIINAFPRMVRDLSRERGKEIELIIEGAETEVDRFVLEQIKDALTHLLRNCVDHAIEEPEVRVAAGKPSWGRVAVRASQQGDRMVLEVADDGAGIDPKAVKAAAVAKGILAPDAAQAMDDRDALWTIFRPGLSTSPIVTDLSGRGVGLDVVYEAVERLQGMIDVDSRPGAGTRFTLTLPLAVAATRCLLVRAAAQTYALPVSGVARILRLDPGAVGRAGGREAVDLDGEPVTLAPLWSLLDIEAPPEADVERLPIVVIGPARRRVALVVEGLAGEQDAVVKRLPPPLVRVPGTAGATILGTGEVVMVLSVPELLRAAARGVAPVRLPAAPTAEEAPTLLVVDDSITTRTLEKNILEAAGYHVRVATDGEHAWSLLEREKVDLLVSDVAMPGMDGFELTERVRADARLANLPVILVTSLASEEHRARGIEVGADAYIVKSSFDQDRLLDTVRRLM